VPAFGIASVNVFGLKAPDEIEGFTLNDSTNFEKIKPGDGYGLDYSQSGWKLDVFIYDLKRAAIPDDAKSAIVRAEFERVRADAFLAQPRGGLCPGLSAAQFHHRRPKQAHPLPVRGIPPDPRWREAQDGYLCVTSWSNKFVKLRFTTLADSNTEAAARKYVAAWIPVLWGRVAAPAPSRPSQARANRRGRKRQCTEPRAQAPRAQAPRAQSRELRRRELRRR
jgi:hypothetical protein